VVVAEELHGSGLPVLLRFELEKELGDYGVMPVREDVRLDEHALPHGALDRIATAIDLGTDRLDDDARRRRLRVLIQA
jgi:hypothetical protein